MDDLALYKAFSAWYSSCKVARGECIHTIAHIWRWFDYFCVSIVVLDASGRSRGYGFVRFTEEYEQQQALLQMQNYTGLGGKPIRVSLATPKTSVTVLRLLLFTEAKIVGQWMIFNTFLNL